MCKHIENEGYPNEPQFMAIYGNVHQCSTWCSKPWGFRGASRHSGGDSFLVHRPYHRDLQGAEVPSMTSEATMRFEKLLWDIIRYYKLCTVIWNLVVHANSAAISRRPCSLLSGWLWAGQEHRQRRWGLASTTDVSSKHLRLPSTTVAELGWMVCWDWPWLVWLKRLAWLDQ